MRNIENYGEWLKFLHKTPKYIKKTSGFRKIKKAIYNDPEAMSYLHKYTLDDIESFDGYEVNESLTKLFNYKKTTRGKSFGKGEILLTFLIGDVRLSSKNNVDLSSTDGNYYEVKNHSCLCNTISFGVAANANATDFGSNLNSLLHKISLRGRYDENFRNQHPMWFEVYNRKNSHHNGKYMVDKFRASEIPKSYISDVFINEIPKLYNKIDHPYAWDVNLYVNDLIETNDYFQELFENVIIWSEGKVHYQNVDLFVSEITQGKFKFSITKNKSSLSGFEVGVIKQKNKVLS